MSKRARARRAGVLTATLEDGVVDLGQFYLGIARRSYEELLKLKGPPKPVRLTKKGEHVYESSHYRNAVACIVFSAVAVEHELMRLVAIRIALQSGDDRNRRLLMGVWSERPRIDDMVRFVRYASKVEAKILDPLKTLFSDRQDAAAGDPQGEDRR